MRNLIYACAFFFFFPIVSQAQIGFRIGYAHPNSLIADINFHKDRNIVHLGGTYQFNGQLGQSRDSQQPNYGRTSLGGDNAYLILLDLGYSRWITRRIAIGAEVSLGTQRFFTNYSDKRFKAGGYHLINYSQFLVGYGGKATYRAWGGLGFFAGYNTLSGINGGISWMPRSDLND